MTPFPRVRPGGSPVPTPVTTLQVAPVAGFPLAGLRLVTICACSVAEYGTPTLAFFGTSFVTICRPALIVKKNWRSAFFGRHHDCDGGSWSLSSMYAAYFPDWVGVPLIVPLEASESPGGSEPLRTRY